MVAGKLQQLGEIGGWVLKHQFEEVGRDGLVQTFLFQESEEVVDAVGVEWDSAVLAVQVFESMTKESAEIFRAEV